MDVVFAVWRFMYGVYCVYSLVKLYCGACLITTAECCSSPEAVVGVSVGRDRCSRNIQAVRKKPPQHAHCESGSGRASLIQNATGLVFRPKFRVWSNTLRFPAWSLGLFISRTCVWMIRALEFHRSVLIGVKRVLGPLLARVEFLFTALMQLH